jgi:putative PIN family toxin of toxin-antitoxin system
MLKVVLDTNVLVSALLSSGGTPDRVLRDAGQVYQLFISHEILEEIEEVLRRPRIQARAQLTEEKVRAFLATIQRVADVIENPPSLQIIKDDPDDDIILGCVVGAQVDYIVSGDVHLRQLGDYEEIQIVSPSEFLIILREGTATERH